MNFASRLFRMPSINQDVNVDLNSNEDACKTKDKNIKKLEKNEKAEASQNVVPAGLSADQRLAFALRDFLRPRSAILRDKRDDPLTSTVSPAPPTQLVPSIDEHLDTEELPISDEDPLQSQDTNEVLNNAACRLRRWRAASRKLRRPRIIDNLEKDGGKEGNGGHTDLADRLRSLAAAGSVLVSASELSSSTLAPPPPAATAPPSPGCVLSPTLSDQSSAEYFGSSPDCCADNIGLEGNLVGTPVPPPGPRYNLATEGPLRVCCFQHTRTVVDKILAAKFLRRWESHVICLQDEHIVSKSPSGLLDQPIPYSSMQEVYCITRWDPARKYCLRIVMSLGSILLQANDAYTRDQWYNSIIWKRNMIRYRSFLTKKYKRELVMKELKNMIDFVMTTPLQDEAVTRDPLQILTNLLAEEKDSPNWEEWAECATNVAAPLLAERCASGDLCELLARLCRQRPRAAPLPALAPPVRRVLTRNVDFAKAPNARQLVKDYISALSAHNSGTALVRRFVEVTHGGRAACPHPRAAPNLAAVALAAIDDHYRDKKTAPHVCQDNEEEVMCFADILEHMCEYEDWLLVVSQVLQPVPFCPSALQCPRVAKRLASVMKAMAKDTRCIVHTSISPTRTARPSPPTWLRVCAPSDPQLALPVQDLTQLWGDMLASLLGCCMRRKSFLQDVSKQLPDFLLAALSEHKAALQALCLMLEWEVASGEQTQLEIIAALQATKLGLTHYRELCEKQLILQKLQSEGGPKQLALPVQATDADVEALLGTGALGNLECLSLAFTSVTSECAHHLIKLPSLRYLNLWATKFGDRGLQLIAEHLPRLQVLNLCETHVSDKGIEALSCLPSLRQLNLNSTRLSAEAFDYLRERLPHLQEYDVRYTEAW